MISQGKSFYRRRLPHLQPDDATFSVTFRVADSLPDHVIIELMEEQARIRKSIESIADKNTRLKVQRENQEQYFYKFDSYLDRVKDGNEWLKDSRVADCVMEAILYRDSRVYDLMAATIMSTHVHMIFVKRNDISLYRLLQSLKRHTAREANKILHRTGAFWHHESYDHVVREGELERIIQYIIDNPIKAGLCRKWQNWRWTYLDSAFTSSEICPTPLIT